VIGVTGTAVQVRAMVRATPDDLWDVECTTRRHLVAWISSSYPQAIPRVRADITAPEDGADDGTDDDDSSSLVESPSTDEDEDEDDAPATDPDGHLDTEVDGSERETDENRVEVLTRRKQKVKK
jgi:hypothetical protein